MAGEINPDTILQLFIAETKAYRSVKSRLFRKQKMIDKLAISDIDEDIGISVQVETEQEFYERKKVEKPASHYKHLKFYKSASPVRPTHFTNQIQEFPLKDTIKYYTCNQFFQIEKGY